MPKTKEEKMHKLAKIIRVLTVAPLMALIAFILIWIFNKDVLIDYTNLILTILFIVAFPLFSYVLQPFIPKFKNEGRKGQRKLAIIMSVIGYVLGLALALILNLSEGTKMIFICYVMAGTLIFVFSKFTPIKASGHACGVAGPIVYLSYFLGPWSLFGLLILVLVYWCSLYMKRHTFRDLIFGTLIPFIAFGIAYLFVVIL